ncbi:probable G-protein coupled receptor Mth-like 10 isoform X3 [Condylostylus longicornis]|uniref:probable G-protein coupled receptor Mth-like 10 isoform X3 n=1 Tax=Condylostylus longicornis TaxID=2530218 RepID=UPI00244DC515|nr:probable G-protein coupled receptor Mth-like 10 isoform X3 [Condylostylus longicornis]
MGKMSFIVYKIVNYSKLIFILINILNVQKIIAIKEAPCNVADSIVLTENHKAPNGSYFYDNILIPDHLIHFNNSVLYGCICLIKNCVPWCCSHKYQSLKNYYCQDENSVENILDKILLKNSNSNNTKYLFEHFHVQMNKKLQCRKTYALNHIENDYDEWHIFDNGTLYQPFYDDNEEYAYSHKNSYCFALEDFKIKDGINFMVSPYFCQNVESSIRHTIYGICLLVSQPFMIITIIIYLAIPKLRNLHGKALVCYLSSLSISYFGLAYILLGKNHDEHFGFCTFVGYVVYVTILSAYFWLSAISFDLWYNFNNYDKARAYQNVRFLTYCGICYGTALIYMITAYLVQNSGASDSVKPGMGTFYCYLNVETGYSAVIWLYGPLSCVIIFNITMFILTWRNIKAVSYELSRVMDKRNLKSERNQEIFFRFHIFLRLFVIMGVSWVAEIASYFVGQQYQHFFYVTDFFNVMQGLLIFILFVLKNDTKKLILKRYDQIRGNRQYSRQYSRTTSSNMVSMNQL